MRHGGYRLALHVVQVKGGVKCGVKLADDADIRTLHDLSSKWLPTHALPRLTRVLSLVTVAQHNIDLLVETLQRTHKVPAVRRDDRHRLLHQLLELRRHVFKEARRCLRFQRVVIYVSNIAALRPLKIKI